ncbi:MAG: hypothetical protein M3Q07_27195, partial [Pseudobdellovibrionaceae bacterium]|nr:hypothetical protein [Pseudobdellovibrionaceae bacterium]
MLQNSIRFLSMLMLVLGLFGCHDQFRGEWQQAARVCGLAPESITEDEVLVQLQTPAGQSLEPEHLLTIRSRFLEPERNASEITLSPGGCAHVPLRNGVLQVVSGTFGWSLAEPLTLASSDHRLLQKRLIPSPQAEAELQCPEEGFFTNDSLDSPLRWSSTGSLQPFHMELIAEDEATGTSVRLFEKPYGENLPASPAILDTRVLAEGRYVMKLSFSSSTEGWDQPRLAPAKKASCPLTVLHHPPLVGGWESLSLTQALPVYAKYSILPWHSSGPESQLLVCREKRGADQDMISSPRIDDNQCPAHDLCKDPRNFEAVTKVVADAAGVFDYFLVVKNKAGIRSSPRCRTIVVSDSKPKLVVNWKNPDWNRTLTHMQLPHATVSLT